MQFLKVISLMLGSLLLCVTLSPPANASEWDKKVIVTFDQDTEIPGLVLPAGTYVFKLAPVNSSRNIVQVWDADEMQLYSTLIAVREYASETPDNAYFLLDNSQEGYPPAVVSWFYPGENMGWSFIYPRAPQVVEE
jgi:hypothetical protein